MTFRKKAQYLLGYDADIYVIQECEEKSKLNIVDLEEYPNRVWIGDNRHKGVCILAKSGINIENYAEYSGNYRYMIPVKISGDYNLTLFAVWAQNDKENPRNRYIGQVWQALQEYQHLLGKDTIIIGDWNSNAIWDKDYRKSTSHSEVVSFLEQCDIVSLYHLETNEKQGEESKSTFAYHKDIQKGYHIDYCFLSKELIKESTRIEVPGFADWIVKSDHVPLLVDL